MKYKYNELDDDDCDRAMISQSVDSWTATNPNQSNNSGVTPEMLKEMAGFQDELKDLYLQQDFKPNKAPEIQTIGQVKKIFEENRMAHWTEGPRNFAEHTQNRSAIDLYRETQHTLKDKQFSNIGEFIVEIRKIGATDPIIQTQVSRADDLAYREMTQAHKSELEAPIGDDRNILIVQHKFEKAFFNFRTLKDENGPNQQTSNQERKSLENQVIQLSNEFNEVNPHLKEQAQTLKQIDGEVQAAPKFVWKKGSRNFFNQTKQDKISHSSDKQEKLISLRDVSHESKARMEKVQYFNLENCLLEDKPTLLKQIDLEKKFFDYRVSKQYQQISNTPESHDRLQASKADLMASRTAYQEHSKEKKQLERTNQSAPSTKVFTENKSLSVEAEKFANELQEQFNRKSKNDYKNSMKI